MTRPRAILAAIGLRTIALTIVAIVLILVGLPQVLVAAAGG